jgi:hypothetical protein
VTRWCGAALVLLLSACGAPPAVRHAVPSGETLPARFSIVCVIHGDGDYLYHDPEGRALRADEEALRVMAGVAARNPRAEVFIFHEQPRRRTLFVLPRPDGRFFRYRGGELRESGSYRRGEGRSRFDPEAKLYHRLRDRDHPPEIRLFLYFGHEIPETGGAVYDASRPSRGFSVEDLARGVREIAGDGGKFDLLVLSTCYGGTPHTIAALAPHARYIVASPGNLHLSWFDPRVFERLDGRPDLADIPGLARHFARQSFDRLAGAVQTEVTVAVYDTDRAREYLGYAVPVYDRALAAARNAVPPERRDCAEDPAFVLPGMSEGVEVWYRPPRFGRMQHKREHSGWECRMEK